ncbi:hypothetical protein BH09SUM1_BH09SUM1_15420 [soil metagenome]
MRPGAAADYLRVSKLQYALYFLLFALILVSIEVKVEKQTDYGLQRVARLRHGDGLFTFGRLEDLDNRTLSEVLQVRPEELLAGQFVVDEFLKRSDQEIFIDWSRLIKIHYGNFVFSVGMEVFRDVLFAFLMAAYLYFRRENALSRELIEYETRNHKMVTEKLIAKTTETTRIIDKFNKLQGKLLEAEKLASIGRLSATLAHEIRNPLTIIKSSTEILTDDLPAGCGAEAAVELIRDEVNRMDRIITDLLNFARPKPPNMERHGLRNLVRHWLPPMVEELEKTQIRLVPQLEDMDAEVYVDADQLWQVFLNVVWNARDALQGSHNPHMFIRTEDAGDNYVKLIVRDTGPGMLPETLKQIREPFFTTKTQGTGLGIPVSIQLIEGMGGRFEMESELEVGATVTLYLLRMSAVIRNSGAVTDGVYVIPPAEIIAEKGTEF